jgi:hypothetical protein
MALSSLFGARKTEQAVVPFTVVVDGRSLAPTRMGEDFLSPRLQLEILQQLSKIARQEEWNLWCVFSGPELEKVSHGGDFLGVRVFFAPTAPQRAPTLVECVKVLKKKGEVLFVTDDPALESRAMDAGAVPMRAETLKKGYEDLFAVRQRPQSRLMRRRTEQMQREGQGGDDVRDLIDLVD